MRNIKLEKLANGNVSAEISEGSTTKVYVISPKKDLTQNGFSIQITDGNDAGYSWKPDEIDFANSVPSSANTDDINVAIKRLGTTFFFELESGGGGSGVQTIVAGANINVDNSDPSNPIVSGTGGGGEFPVSRGLISGDSTVAEYFSYSSIASLLVTQADIDAGSSINDIAEMGNTIAQQRAKWDILTDKNSYDYIIVQIGLNDLGSTTATTISALQSYINDINTFRKAGSKLIVGTMIPAKQRLISLLGNVGYTRWQELNDAILGNGSTPITGVDLRVNTHTVALNDGYDNLADYYDTGDKIHENDEGRYVISQGYRAQLMTIGFLPNVSNNQILGNLARFEGIEGVFQELQIMGNAANPKNSGFAIGQFSNGEAILFNRFNNNIRIAIDDQNILSFGKLFGIRGSSDFSSGYTNLDYVQLGWVLKNIAKGVSKIIAAGEESGFIDPRFVGSVFTQLFVDGSYMNPTIDYVVNTSSGAISFTSPLSAGNVISCLITYQ